MKLLDFFRDLFSDNKEEVNSQNQPKMSGVITPARRKKMGRLNTKHFQVKNHLIKIGTIDSWTAIELYGATRLSAIIFNLRKEGMNIDSISCTSYDRNTEICNYTTYKLVQSDENN
jgi:hypothetical protein